MAIERSRDLADDVIYHQIDPAGIGRNVSYQLTAIVASTQNQHSYRLRLYWVDDGGASNVLVDSVNNGGHQLAVVDIGTQSA